MAEKIKEIRSVSYAHEVYCDKCNKFLGESEECAEFLEEIIKIWHSGAK